MSKNFILSYDILYGRDPNRKDIIVTKKVELVTIQECEDWVQKNFEPNSIWWVTYTITKEKEIIKFCSNENLKLVNGNYLENR